MTDVKRYKKHGEILGRVLVAAQDGDYVKYADYAALRARLAEVEKDFREEITLCENLSIRLERAEAALATAQRDALEKAAEVCTNIIRDYDVMKPNGTTYEPVHVQRAAKGMVSLARQDIRALITQEEPKT